MSRLVVYVPGLGKVPHNIDGLWEKLQSDPAFGPPHDNRLYRYTAGVRLLSRGALNAHCQKLAGRIDACAAMIDSVDDVILIGHSIGGLMVRAAYLEALSAQQDWAQKVSRILLLAAPNRGFALTRLAWWKKPAAYALAALPFGFTCKDALLGSAFVSNLRIRWIGEMADHETAPIVVQLLGDDDDLVAYEDSRDVQAMLTGAQRAIPMGSHSNIVAVKDVPEDVPGQRYFILRWAILGDVDTEGSIPKPLPKEEDNAQAIVFALHGIRAGNGDWPERLRRRLSQPGAQPREIPMHVVTPSYGRMSAINFALPFSRRRHLRWFADKYTFYYARHHKKPLHFVGHSNGTYILGQAFQQIPALHFDRVFLAGTVLPQDFDWLRYSDGRIDQMLNVCANKDKPVAWLCSALRGFGQDVGPGGFGGFESYPDSPSGQTRWIKGGHGAALVEPTAESPTTGLAAVADYVRGEDNLDGRYKAAEPRFWFAWLSRGAPYLAWSGLAAIIAVGWAAIALCGPQAGAAVIVAMLMALALALKTV
jgi:hypothetical protein